jgi:hypothetical protein
VTELLSREPSLEELFLAHYGGRPAVGGDGAEGAGADGADGADRRRRG